MEVGSCINTLVSSTKRRRPSRARARGSARSAEAGSEAVMIVDEAATGVDSETGPRACAWAGPGSERLRCFKHFLRVPRNLHLTPFPPQHPFGVDEKGAALDAEILPAIEAFLADDLEQLANLFLLIRQQSEGQRLLGLEFLVACDAVARDADDLHAGLAEGHVQVTKILRLARASRSHVR